MKVSTSTPQNINYEIMSIVTGQSIINGGFSGFANAITTSIKKATDMSIESMIKHAEEIGADSIIEVRIETTCGNNCYIATAYGTAIKYIN